MARKTGKVKGKRGDNEKLRTNCTLRKTEEEFLIHSVGNYIALQMCFNEN